MTERPSEMASKSVSTDLETSSSTSQLGELPQSAGSRTVQAPPTGPALYPNHVAHLGGLVRILAVLALLGTLVGRSLAPSLLGAADGIDSLIQRVELLGALVSVHFFVGASLLATWLALVLMTERRLVLSLRSVAVPGVAVVQVLTIAGYWGPLSAGNLLWLSLVSAGIALVVAPKTVAEPRTRALGLLLLSAAFASLVDVTGRVMAIRSSDLALDDWFFFSRVVASVAFLFKVLGLIIVLIWLGQWRWKRQLVFLVAGLSSGALVGWGAMYGLQSARTFGLVWMGRAMAELTRIPYPLFLPVIRFAVEGINLALVIALLALPGRPRTLAGAAALALLASGATDIPICALMLTLSALIASLEAAGSSFRLVSDTLQSKDLSIVA